MPHVRSNMHNNHNLFYNNEENNNMYNLFMSVNCFNKFARKC